MTGVIGATKLQIIVTGGVTAIAHSPVPIGGVVPGWGQEGCEVGFVVDCGHNLGQWYRPKKQMDCRNDGTIHHDDSVECKRLVFYEQLELRKQCLEVF